MDADTIDISPLSVGGKATNLKETVVIPPGLQRMKGARPDEHHGVFRILHPEFGDERLTWDSRDFEQIKAAKKMFLDLIKKGLKPFMVGRDGKVSSKAMAEFDPRAEEVVFLPTKLVKGG